LDEAIKVAGKEYEDILKDILSRKDSSDFNNFLFSLENNKSKNFSYTRLIEKNKKLKLSILVFYGALAYYSANLLRKSGISIPKNILLSGTAAKSASMLDSSSDNLANLSSMFKFIFEKVYKEKIERNMILKVAANPKEITCKGALGSGITESINDNTIKFWLGGVDGSIWGDVIDKEKDVLRTPKYDNIDLYIKSRINDSIIEFYRILDDYVATVRFDTKFLIEQEAYDKFKEIREIDIADFLSRGLRVFHKRGKGILKKHFSFIL
jgi:hypothetical protein